MTTFNKTVRELMLTASNGYCQCSDECVEQVTEFHHLLPNTEVNRNKYPLFLQSPFNCCPINNGCHMSKPKRKIRENLAQAFETWLQMQKGIE